MNFSFWARLFVSLTAISVVLWWIDWDEFSDTVKQANVYWLLAVFVYTHIARAFMVYKWSLLLRGVGVVVPFITALQAYYIGAFWATYLPASVGGDVVRITWLINKIQSGAQIASSVIIERLFGFVAGTIMAVGSLVVCAVWIRVSITGFPMVISFLFVLSISCLAFIFSHKAHFFFQKFIAYLPFRGVTHRIEKMRVAILEFKAKPTLMVTFFFLTLLEQISPIVGNFMLVKALSIDLSVVWVAIGTPLILIVSKLPISLDGLGVVEGVGAYIYSFAGVPMHEIVVMVLISRVLTILSSLPGALFMGSKQKSTLPVGGQTKNP